MAPRRGRSARGGSAAPNRPVRVTTVGDDGVTNQVWVVSSDGQIRAYDIVPHTPGDSFLTLSYKPQTVHRTFVTLRYKQAVSRAVNLGSGALISGQPGTTISNDVPLVGKQTSVLHYDTPISIGESDTVTAKSLEGSIQPQALLLQADSLPSEPVSNSNTPAPLTPASICSVPSLQNSYLISGQELEGIPTISIQEATADSTDCTPHTSYSISGLHSNPTELLAPSSTLVRSRRAKSANTASARTRTRRLRNQLAEQDSNLSSSGGQAISQTFLAETNMAPVRDPNDVSIAIKDVFQNLYDIQSQTHGFIPETQELLVDKMTDLTQTLSYLQKLTSPIQSPNNPVHKLAIAPEIVDYVDDGRNPDIFTRDFVENVQRGNAVINGKQQAFHDFAQILAKAMKEGMTGVDRHVDHIMDHAGIEQLSTEPKQEVRK